MSLCELVVGGKEGLQPVEKTVIDRCVHQIYQEYFQDPRPEKMPLLEDLYNALLKQEENAASKPSVTKPKTREKEAETRQ